MIYFDNAATTRPYPYLTSVYEQYAGDFWLNPSSLYSGHVRKMMDETRELVRNCLGVSHQNILFTSSATLSNNIVILGLKKNLENRSIIIHSWDHPSCINPVRQYKERSGDNGTEVILVDYPDLYKELKNNIPSREIIRNIMNNLLGKINEKTGLVVLSWINNETGLVMPVREMTEKIKAKNPDTLILLDATQGFGKFPVKKQDFELCDFITASSHKFHGIRGSGILCARNLNKISPVLFGGGQEMNFFPSTENILPILSVNTILKRETPLLGNTMEELINLKRYFYGELGKFREKNPGYPFFAFPDTPDFSPYIIRFFLKSARSEVVVNALSGESIYCSYGSACSTKSSSKTDLAKSMGIPSEYAVGGIRVSFSKFNTRKEIDLFFEKLELILGQYIF